MAISSSLARRASRDLFAASLFLRLRSQYAVSLSSSGKGLPRRLEVPFELLLEVGKADEGGDVTVGKTAVRFVESAWLWWTWLESLDWSDNSDDGSVESELFGMGVKDVVVGVDIDTVLRLWVFCIFFWSRNCFQI